MNMRVDRLVVIIARLNGEVHLGAGRVEVAVGRDVNQETAERGDNPAFACDLAVALIGDLLR